MPTIKVTDDEYSMVMEARKRLAMQGLSTLPRNVQKEVNLDDAAKFTMGAIVGIGIVMLLEELNKK